MDQMTKRPKLTILDTMNFWLDSTLRGINRSNKKSGCVDLK